MESNKTPKVIFFDDQEESDGELRRNLCTALDVHLSLPPPLNDLDKSMYIDDKLPNGFLVDYRLTSGKLSDGSNIYYSGIVLLLAIRDSLDKKIDLVKKKSHEIPLIAISQYRYFTKGEEKEDMKRVREVADYIIYKEDVLEKPVEAVKRIRSIIDDFPQISRIKRQDRSWDELVSLLNPPDTEYVSSLLLNANPPLSAFSILLDERDAVQKTAVSEKTVRPTHTPKASWTIRNATKWIIYTLFEFPGVLYDSLHASTALGLDLDSFKDSKWIQSTFESAKYTGIFNDVDDFWWKYKLFEIAYDLLDAKNLGAPLAGNFPEVCPSESKLKHNKCIYSGESGADVVCYLLKEPVRREHALEYSIEDRPIPMDLAFLSRLAYETSNEVIEDLLTASAKGKLNKWYKRQGEE